MKQTDLSLIFAWVHVRSTSVPPQCDSPNNYPQSMVEKKKEKLYSPVNSSFTIIEPRHEKTGLRGVRPGPT